VNGVPCGLTLYSSSLASINMSFLHLLTIAGRLGLAVHATPSGDDFDNWSLVSIDLCFSVRTKRLPIDLLLVSHVEPRSYGCNARTRSRTGRLHTRHTRQSRDDLECFALTRYRCTDHQSWTSKRAARLASFTLDHPNCDDTRWLDV
jgi:hypothetical protein